jgi:tetratricopeptide (TPR) repeat protein
MINLLFNDNDLQSIEVRENVINNLSFNDIANLRLVCQASSNTAYPRKYLSENYRNFWRKLPYNGTPNEIIQFVDLNIANPYAITCIKEALAGFFDTTAPTRWLANGLSNLNNEINFMQAIAGVLTTHKIATTLQIDQLKLLLQLLQNPNTIIPNNISPRTIYSVICTCLIVTRTTSLTALLQERVIHNCNDYFNLPGLPLTPIEEESSEQHRCQGYLYFQEAKKLANPQLYSAALDELDKCINLRPCPHAIYLCNRGEVLTALNRLPEAIAYHNLVLSVWKDLNQFLFIINILAKQNNFTQALYYCELLLKIDGYSQANVYIIHKFALLLCAKNRSNAPENYEKEFNLLCQQHAELQQFCSGQLILELHQYDKAIKIINIILQYDSNNTLALTQKALVLLGQRHYLEAMQIATLVSAQLTNHIPTLIQCTSCLLRQGLYEGTNQILNIIFAKCNSALAINPNDIDLCLNCGYIAMKISNYQAALAAFNHALNLNPNNFLARHKRLSAINQLNLFEHYMPHLNENETNPDLLYEHGCMLMGLGNDLQALQSFHNSLSLQPNAAKALKARGLAYLNLGQNTEALEDFTASLALIPDQVSVLIARGKAFYRLGRYQEALDSLSHALRLHPNSSLALYQQAQVAAALGKVAETNASCTFSLNIIAGELSVGPNNPDLLALRGAVLFLLNRQNDAQQSFQSSLTIRPNHVATLRLLAESQGF